MPRMKTRYRFGSKNEAQRLGFELVGISPVKLPPHEESFAEWLRRGFSGQLEYMKRTEELRRDPHRLVPWAVSAYLGRNELLYAVFPSASIAAAEGLDFPLCMGR